MNLPTSQPPTKNFTKNLYVDCILDSQKPHKSSSVISTESNTPKTPKTHPFYQNLVDVLKMEKEFEDLSMKAKQHSVPVRKLSNKKVFLKSKTQVVSDDIEEDFLQLRAEKNTAADMNSIFELTPKDLAQAKQSESQSAGSFCRQNIKSKTGVINRFSLRGDEDCQDNSPKKKRGNYLGEHPFRHLIFNPNSSMPQKEFFKHLLSIQKGLIYAEKQIKKPADHMVAPKTVPLDPLPHGMRTLVLDLDGTLVHAIDNKNDTPGHVTLKMKDDEGSLKTFGVHFRPYLHYFLEKITPYFEIAVFTSALPNYASAIVDYIDPHKKIIKYVMCRDRCLVTKNGVYIKDLRVLGNRDLKDMLIVDNLTHNFCLQVDNGVPILDYQDDPDDKELKYLAEYLVQCAEADDMVDFNSKYLRLRELVDFVLSPKNDKGI